MKTILFKLSVLSFPLFSAVCGFFYSYSNKLFAYSIGPPDGRTGSSADNYKTCYDAGCHNSHTLNSGNAKFSVSTPPRYSQGEILTIRVSFHNSSGAKHGFELSALDTDNNHIGTFRSIDDTTQTGDGNYIKHTTEGSNQYGNAGWSVQWIAPVSEILKPVTLYAAGNEANGDGTPQGDYIYTTTATMEQN